MIIVNLNPGRMVQIEVEGDEVQFPVEVIPDLLEALTKALGEQGWADSEKSTVDKPITVLKIQYPEDLEASET